MKIAMMFAGQRSGTHALGSVIKSSEGARYIGEIFHFNAEGKPDRFLNEFPPDPELKDDAAFRSMLKQFFEAQPNPDGKRLVADIKYLQVRGLSKRYGLENGYDALVPFIKEHDAPVFFLIRRNLLRQSLSLVRGRVTGEMTLKKSASDARITVDPAEVIATADGFAKQIKQAKKALQDVDPAFFYYEDVFVDGEVVPEQLQRLADALRIENRFESAKPNTVKIAPKSLRDMVENYDELAACLKGGPYEEMLEQA